ncbi:hypothetical protein QUF61_09960 [Candidatus Venteria ishoeyi]|uniref:hypothetical protein n=1 Tax=Candidatus Venteria ishoeyi TaxID=1899563 RepID=UPI0025A5399E|nr:hypothetical protein [Candidatus Venteria ishoeyi]MDM8546805.1 hypothetical protein [Candidatus Venteria ishoeyi]
MPQGDNFDFAQGNFKDCVINVQSPHGEQDKKTASAAETVLHPLDRDILPWLPDRVEQNNTLRRAWDGYCQLYPGRGIGQLHQINL